MRAGAETYGRRFVDLSILDLIDGNKSEEFDMVPCSSNALTKIKLGEVFDMRIDWKYS